MFVRTSRGKEHAGRRLRIWKTVLMRKWAPHGGRLRNRRRLRVGVQKGDIWSIMKEDLGDMGFSWLRGGNSARFIQSVLNLWKFLSSQLVFRE